MPHIAKNGTSSLPRRNDDYAFNVASGSLKSALLTLFQFVFQHAAYDEAAFHHQVSFRKHSSSPNPRQRKTHSPYLAQNIEHSSPFSQKQMAHTTIKCWKTSRPVLPSQYQQSQVQSISQFGQMTHRHHPSTETNSTAPILPPRGNQRSSDSLFTVTAD